jgi:hypothetical protein
MNKRNLTDSLKKKLRDPIWQFFGVLLALITLLSSLIIAYLVFPTGRSTPSRVMIATETAKDLTDFPEPVSKRMRFLIDDKEERDLRLFIYRIEYKGDQPIRSWDFEKPMRGTIPTTRKLVAVQTSPNLEGPLRVDRETGRAERDTKPPINFEVSIIDPQTFEIKPVLMNPGEWFGIEIYTSAQDSDNSKLPAPTPPDQAEKTRRLHSEISWSCHVAGVQCPGQWDFGLDFEFLGTDAPWFLQISVDHEGWAVYVIVLFTVVNLLLMVLLAKTARLGEARPAIQVILFSLAIASSLASAEVATDWLFPDRILGVVFDLGQPLFAYTIFWLNVSIIIGLAAISILKKKRVRRRRSVRPQIDA